MNLYECMYVSEALSNAFEASNNNKYTELSLFQNKTLQFLLSLYIGVHKLWIV